MVSGEDSIRYLKSSRRSFAVEEKFVNDWQEVFEYVIFPVIDLLQSRKNLLTIGHEGFEYVIFSVGDLLQSTRIFFKRLAITVLNM